MMSVLPEVMRCMQVKRESTPPKAEWATGQVRYMNKTKNASVIDTLGVVYIDSLCLRYPSSGNTACVMPTDTFYSGIHNYFRGKEDVYGPRWTWYGPMIPTTETLLDASFVAILRHPKTGEELARERFTVPLKRFNDNRFVILR